jgi:WS/DGAT/MGAT family acyltransferase
VVLTRLRADELANAWVGDRATPFQIALLGVFDATPFTRQGGTCGPASGGSVDVARIRRELAVRARQLPALGRRVVWTRWGEGRPVWVPDPSFDPAAHVRTATLPAGQDLHGWAAGRAVRPLDLDRPLWRAEVVDGLPVGRFAVLLVVHHILADGLGGVALAGALMDPAPDTRGSSDHPPAARWVPSLPSRRDLRRDARQEARSELRRVRPPSLSGLARVARSAHQFRTMMTDFRAAPPTSLPRQIGPDRRLVIVRQPLVDLRNAGHALGATVNDLILVALTDGLRDMLAARGDQVAERTLRAIVPASTGRAGQVVGMLVVDLPVGEPDPRRRLTLVRASTAAAKARLSGADADAAEVLRLPVAVARPVVRWARRFGSRRIDVSLADVAGPTGPLWLAGARLEHAVPIAPLVPLVPLAAAALSYAGELAISVNADAAIAELDVLSSGMEASFAVLRGLADVAAEAP